MYAVLFISLIAILILELLIFSTFSGNMGHYSEINIKEGVLMLPLCIGPVHHL